VLANVGSAVMKRDAVTVETGHAVVHEDNVGPVQADELVCLIAVGRFIDIRPVTSRPANK
jgi:hypothetical protein